MTDDAYADGVLAERAIDDLRRLKDKDQPFFLAVGFFKPHLPFIAPQKYWDLYDHEDIHLPDNYHVCLLKIPTAFTDKDLCRLPLRRGGRLE